MYCSEGGVSRWGDRTFGSFAVSVEPLGYTAYFDSEDSVKSFFRQLTVADSICQVALPELADWGVDSDLTRPIRMTWLDFVDDWLIDRETQLVLLHGATKLASVSNPSIQGEIELVRSTRRQMMEIRANNEAESLGPDSELPAWGFSLSAMRTASPVFVRCWVPTWIARPGEYWGFDLNLASELDERAWFDDSRDRDFFRQVLACRAEALLSVGRLLAPYRPDSTVVRLCDIAWRAVTQEYDWIVVGSDLYSRIAAEDNELEQTPRV